MLFDWSLMVTFLKFQVRNVRWPQTVSERTILFRFSELSKTRSCVEFFLELM